MIALEKPSFIAIEDYLEGELASEVRHEYLAGAVYAMSGGTARHSAIATNAVGIWFGQLRGKSCRPFNSDLKVRIELPDHTRFYYPDAQVVCGKTTGSDLYESSPTVILEVLSESTRRTDLGEKRDAYLMIPSLRVLIFAESDEARVSVYRRRKDGGFAIEDYSGAGSSVELAEIDATLSLAELYEEIEFPAADEVKE